MKENISFTADRTAAVVGDPTDWHGQVLRSITGPEALAKIAGSTENGGLNAVIERYPMRLTPFLLSRVAGDGPDGPLSRQFIPCVEELREYPRLSRDPFDETRLSPVPGLIHRYPDRALVLLTNRCAAHCRHCFRKHRWNERPRDLDAKEKGGIIEYLKRAPGIREVILSGGDPLMASDDVLSDFLEKLRGIGHVEVLRIATRIPVVLPVRVTDDFADLLSGFRPLWITVQVNHPVELSVETREACERLIRRGIPVLSQSVLIRGVNDRVETLAELFRGLEQASIKPYYLHQADPVEGTEHFRTSLARGMEIMAALRGRIAGPALPAFVVDCPGGGGKVPVHPPYVASPPDGNDVILKPPLGPPTVYPNPRR